MIPGVEPLYERIAEAMAAAVPEEWVSAEYQARFYADGSTYEAEYIRPDGVARSFTPDGGRAVRELRRLFKQSGRPVWGQVWFLLRADGSFNVRWGYDGCDANGDLPFDGTAELERHEERRLRLLAGLPRRAEPGAESDPAK